MYDFIVYVYIPTNHRFTLIADRRKKERSLVLFGQVTFPESEHANLQNLLYYSIFFSLFVATNNCCISKSITL